MMFYMTEQERETIERSMKEVLEFAFAFVEERTARSARTLGN
jgi:hypothetical protein